MQILFDVFYVASLVDRGPRSFHLVSWCFSAQFSCSVMSNSLWTHGLQHTRPPCPSPTPRVHSNLCPLSWEAIQSSHLLSSPSLPTLSLSQHQGLFKWIILPIRWPNYWSLSFNISPSNEHLELISFRMDSLDLLAFQGTLKSLLQHHSSKASIFGAQLSS